MGMDMLKGLGTTLRELGQKADHHLLSRREA